MEGIEPTTDIVSQKSNGIKAGDPSQGLWHLSTSDEIQYCFRLKGLTHRDGAFAALSPYKPWWLDLKTDWNDAIDDLREKFKKWTIDHASKKDKPPTHVAMNSGSLSVTLGPEEDHFLLCYSKCLLAGHRMYFVEQLSYSWTPPCFRLFMDLDFKQLVGITERGVEAASTVCNVTVAKFFPGRSSNCIVASTTYKNCHALDSSGNKLTLVKTGVHLYWPSYFVTPLQCLHIRESIIASLLETFGQRTEPQQNSWADVVDKSVYGEAHGGKGSGLRMIGSCKTDRCGTCMGKGTEKSEGTKCKTCNGYKRVDDYDNSGRRGRPYMMLCVLCAPDEHGHCTRNVDVEKLYLADMHRLILDTKLRTSLTESTLDNGFDLPSGAPLYIAPNGRKRTAAVLAPSARGEKHVDPGKPEYNELQRVIRESFGQIYSKAIVSKAKEHKGRFVVSVTGSNCRYCQNIGREHRSNNIYFEITRDGIIQKCLDRGDFTPEMKHGPCSSYSSFRVPLDPATSASLWPSTKDAVSVFKSSTEISEDSPEAFSLQCLLNSIEFLGIKLYQESTISGYGLYKNGRSKRMGLRDFVPQDPRDLGSRGIRGYKDLGFSWADTLVDYESLDSDNNDEPHQRISIADKEAALLRDFMMYVSAACTASDPSVFDSCVFIGDLGRDLVHCCDSSDDDSPPQKKSNGLIMFDD
jgi:hypothetical protein